MSGSVTSNHGGDYGTVLFSNSTNMPPCRDGSLGWMDSLGNLWMFGGLNFTTNNYYNDMWNLFLIRHVHIQKLIP